MAEVLPAKQLFLVLSGPMLARELAGGKRGFAVLAAKNKKDFSRVADIFKETKLELMYSSDLRGVSLCGVLKNIYAVGLGIIDGLEAGSNSKGEYAALAICEMAEIIKILGGKKETALGTAGAGDLIATAFSPLSRNRKTGEELGKTNVCCLQSEGSRSVGPVVKLLGKNAAKFKFLGILKSIILDGKEPRILK